MSKQDHIAREQELVRGLKAGNAQSLEKLYDAYGATLYGVVLKIVQVEEVAEDILQESFVKIWKNIQSYDSKKGRLFTWMLNIARNRAIDYRRSAAFKASQQVQSIEDFVGMTEDHQRTHQAVDHIGLREVIDTLKPEQQVVLEYLYFKGYTQAELSKEKGIPLGTVKSRVKIALRELRKLLAK